MKLKYYAHAYRLFERVLQDKQFLGETMEPAARLFAQFHAPQTNRMKKELIEEIKKENSGVRVVFATSALGMGVDAPFVTQVIHISPPSNLESYMQEIGRAGRTGLQSYATIFARNYGTAAVISYNLNGIAPPRSPSSMLDRQKPDVWLRGANIETGGGREGGKMYQ
jgi:superfamily II DNA or RNA helicase